MIKVVNCEHCKYFNGKTGKHRIFEWVGWCTEKSILQHRAFEAYVNECKKYENVNEHGNEER